MNIDVPYIEEFLYNGLKTQYKRVLKIKEFYNAGFNHRKRVFDGIPMPRKYPAFYVHINSNNKIYVIYAENTEVGRVYGYCIFDDIRNDGFYGRDDYSMDVFDKVTLNVSAILNAIIKTQEKCDDITRLMHEESVHKISIPAGHRHYWEVN